MGLNFAPLLPAAMVLLGWARGTRKGFKIRSLIQDVGTSQGELCFW